MIKNVNMLLVGIISIHVFNCNGLVYGFPVLYGDDYTVTFQFEGEQPITVSPIQNWGVGRTFNGGQFTGTDFETLWSGRTNEHFQSEYVAWRTFSSNLEEGLSTLHVSNSHASIRAQIQHLTATYVDVTVSGLDGWVDYPDLTVLNDFQPDYDSVKCVEYHISSYFISGTTLSFRTPLDTWPGNVKFNEINIGFRGEPVPEPATILLLGLGYLSLRKRKP